MSFPFAGAKLGLSGVVCEREERSRFFTKTYWKADTAVMGSKNIYMWMFPNIEYTFKKTDLTGKEIG